MIEKTYTKAEVEAILKANGVDPSDFSEGKVRCSVFHKDYVELGPGDGPGTDRDLQMVEGAKTAHISLTAESAGRLIRILEGHFFPGGRQP